MPSPWRREQGAGSTGPLVKQSEVFDQQLFLFKDKHLAQTTGASKGNNADLSRITACFYRNRGDESVPWPLRSITDIWHQKPHRHGRKPQQHSFPIVPNTVPVWTRVLATLLFSLGTLCMFPCCHPRLRGCPAEADQKEKASTCRKQITAKSEEGHIPDLIGHSFASEQSESLQLRDLEGF